MSPLNHFCTSDEVPTPTTTTDNPTPMSSSLHGDLICGLINPWYYNDHQSSMTRGITGPCQCQWSTWTKIIPMKVVIKFVHRAEDKVLIVTK